MTLYKMMSAILEFFCLKLSQGLSATVSTVGMSDTCQRGVVENICCWWSWCRRIHVVEEVMNFTAWNTSALI